MIQLETAQSSDLPNIEKAKAEGIRKYIKNFKEPDLAPKIPISDYTVIRKNGVFCGYTRAMYGGGILFIENLDILPEYRCMSVGSVVLELLYEKFQSGDAEVQVFDHNPRAVSFFERNGFEEYGRSNGFVYLRKFLIKN